MTIGAHGPPARSQDSLRIEVAAAWPQRQRLIVLVVAPGTTVGVALELAAPQLGADAPGPGVPVGVWGTPVAREHVLVDGDRVEIYRPLPADPRDTRRRLAREGRTMGRPRAR